MKRQIRTNVFETNSSSMHSLTVMKINQYYTEEEILNDIYLHNEEGKCVWEIWDQELDFGRSFRALGTFKEKWLYACASLICDYKDDIYKELVTLALKYVPGLEEIKFPMNLNKFADKNDEEHKNDEYYQKYGKTEEELQEYLLQKEKDWGLETEYWKSSNGYWYYKEPYTGYVDENILSTFLKYENISLEEFLINKKYVVIQDGDEYCYWDDIKKTGLINMDMIDHEYPN